MRARCINDHNATGEDGLVKGKTYDVRNHLGDSPYYYDVFINDRWKEAYFKNRFEIIEPKSPARQSIETKFVGHTQTKPSRIIATTSGGKKLVVSTSHLDGTDEENHTFVAETLFKQLGWPGKLVCGTTKKGYVFVVINKF